MSSPFTPVPVKYCSFARKVTLRGVTIGRGPEAESFTSERVVNAAGLESDGADLFYCGGGSSGKVRAVRRPKGQRP